MRLGCIKHTLRNNIMGLDATVEVEEIVFSSSVGIYEGINIE